MPDAIMVPLVKAVAACMRPHVNEQGTFPELIGRNTGDSGPGTAAADYDISYHENSPLMFIPEILCFLLPSRFCLWSAFHAFKQS